VHWIKLGHTPVAVPIHPKDAKDKLPINRAGLQPVKTKDGLHVTPVRLEPGKHIEVLKSPPKEFSHTPQTVLAHVDAPRMQAVALHDNAKAGIVARTAIPVTFNHQQGFVTSHQVFQGGRPVAVSVPVGRVGGGFSGGPAPSGGFQGHGGVGFGAVASTHGGGFVGGGHGGGGSIGGGGGGGGSVHGGGTVSVTSTTTSTSTATSTAAPSSGSHK
jgi:hypothetical protein